MAIESLIDCVKRRVERDISYAIYSASGDDFSPTDEVFVDENVFVTDDDEEVYPAAVVARKLRFAYSAHNFQDVVDLAVKQKPGVSDERIIEALNYYSEHDDFLDMD